MVGGRTAQGLAVLTAFVACGSCNPYDPEQTATSTEALSGAIRVSGEINDAHGLPLAGAHVMLLGLPPGGEPGGGDW